jgi:hypothetical protein
MRGVGGKKKRKWRKEGDFCCGSGCCYRGGKRVNVVVDVDDADSAL